MVLTLVKGLFTWREKDPRRRITFSFGLHAEISVGVVTKCRRKKKCRPLAAERSAAAILFFFVPSTGIFRAKVVYMELGSSCLSARKILALGPSTTFCM